MLKLKCNTKKPVPIVLIGTIIAGYLNMSCSTKFIESETVFELPVVETMLDLLAGYDTDGDKRITKDDAPQKDYFMVTTKGDTVILRNTYYISNLLQELAIANDSAQENLLISLSQIQEPPAERISRRIRTHFWDELTRTVDEKGLNRIAMDEKMHDARQRVYVPYHDSEGINYFMELQQRRRNLEVVILPPVITAEYVRSINDKPGILALKIKNGKGVPFVVSRWAF
jgi:alpha,alpha-trehalase